MRIDKIRGSRELGIWRCSLDDLRWHKSTLSYDLKTPDGAYKCSTHVLKGPKIETSCSGAFQPICGPLGFAGITLGSSTDSEVQRLLGNEVSRDDADTISRIFVDPQNTATLHVKSCTDAIVCEVVVQVGIVVNPTDVHAATSQWFNPLQKFGRLHALQLGATKSEVRKNLGDPLNGNAGEAWRYDSTCACEIPRFFTVHFKNDRIHKIVFSAPSD